MRNQTVNGVDPSGSFVVSESNALVNIRCDTTHASYILTTSPTPLAKNCILYVQGHGEYYCYAGSSTRRSNMRSFLIMLTLSGYEILEYENARYEMGPGTFYWIDCMKPHYFYTLSREQPRHAMWVHINGPTAEFYYRQFLRINENSPVCNLPDDDGIVEGIKKLIRLYHNNDESLDVDITASAIATNIAVACVRAASANSVLSPIPKAILAIKNYIALNFNEQITLDSLAKRFSINKYHLQKQFKRYVGLTPGEFVQHTRIARAKELLRTTDNSVGEIAYEVGFNSASNFSRTFTKHENATPMSYRKNWVDPHLTIFSE